MGNSVAAHRLLARAQVACGGCYACRLREQHTSDRRYVEQLIDPSTDGDYSQTLQLEKLRMM